MAERLRYGKAYPEGIHALLNLGHTINNSGLEEGLLHLVFLRASLLNGCAYCIDMHTKDARALGETEQRLYSISVWRETSYYTPREQAALAWTEAITNIQQGHAPEAVYQMAHREFGDADMVKLTLAIGQINVWNRIAIGFRSSRELISRKQKQKPARPRPRVEVQPEISGSRSR